MNRKTKIRNTAKLTDSVFQTTPSYAFDLAASRAKFVCVCVCFSRPKIVSKQALYASGINTICICGSDRLYIHVYCTCINTAVQNLALCSLALSCRMASSSRLADDVHVGFERSPWALVHIF